MARRSIHVDGYSHQNPIPVASRVGNVIASSVISAIKPETGETPESLEEQCEVVFANMRAILAAGGATPEDIVKVSFYMADLSGRQVMNRFWLEMFPDADSRPARHTQHEQLMPPRLISADFIAVLDG
ncbi:MAG TPA: RidA family protein [Solirubrobacteraceae bacterium]|jgi:2-iminobutanoate/2-iminopropanoate deaminase